MSMLVPLGIIEQSLKSPKKSGQPSAETPAVPAKASPASPSSSMPSGCIHGGSCLHSHVKSPPPAKDKSDPKADAKAKPRQSTPKVAAAVAIVAACWRVVHGWSLKSFRCLEKVFWLHCAFWLSYRDRFNKRAGETSQ